MAVEVSKRHHEPLGGIHCLRLSVIPIPDSDYAEVCYAYDAMKAISKDTGAPWYSYLHTICGLGIRPVDLAFVESDFSNRSCVKRSKLYESASIKL